MRRPRSRAEASWRRIRCAEGVEGRRGGRAARGRRCPTPPGPRRWRWPSRGSPCRARTRHRRQEDRRDVGDTDDVERRPRVLKATHPSLRGRGHEHERGAERRDADPLQPLRGCGGRSARHRMQGRLRDELDRHHEDRPQPKREPGRLNPGVEREAMLARAVEARRPRRRRTRGRCRTRGSRQAGGPPARGRPAAPCQVADDRRVAQDVEGSATSAPSAGSASASTSRSDGIRVSTLGSLPRSAGARRGSPRPSGGPPRRRRPRRAACGAR